MTTEHAHILLVDDQAMVAEAVRRMLEPFGHFTLEYCAEGDKALETAIAFKPSVILQDLVMPDCDGLDLLKQYLRHEATCDIPVIVLSSNDNAETKAEAFANGANDYLVKLPDPVEFLARLCYHSRAYAEHKVLQATIHELRDTQSQLLQSEKMASLGQLAAGVAHEINNPAGFVLSNLGRLNEAMDVIFSMVSIYEDAITDKVGRDRIKAYQAEHDWDFLKQDLPGLVNESLDGIKRIQHIVLELRDFTGVDQNEWQTTDIHHSLEGSLKELRKQLPSDADLKTGFTQLPDIDCMPAQLKQAFLNVLTNARQALQDGGTIRLSTGHSSQPEIKGWGMGNGLRCLNTVDDWAWVEIEDDGCGIAEDQLHKIFDPFFTTRPVGHGTGLGLWLTSGIINRHSGFFDIHSTPRAGTRVRIWLPVKQADRQTQAA